MNNNSVVRQVVSSIMVSVIVVAVFLLSGCAAINQTPVISSYTATSEQVNPSETVKISCEARDPDRDEITYTWSASGGTITGNSPEIEWKAPEKSGDYTIKVTVSDGKGGNISKEILINVLAKNNSPPFIRKVTYEPNRYEIYDDEKLSFTCTAMDPEGDKLTYTWEVTGGKIEGTGPNVVWITPIELNEKEHTVTIYVTDIAGNRSVKQFVTVKILCDCYRLDAPKK